MQPSQHRRPTRIRDNGGYERQKNFPHNRRHTNTYRFVHKLDECIPSRLSLVYAGLVKQEVQFCDFPKLCEDLKQGIS